MLVPEAVKPPGEDVTVYSVMALPPLFTGGLKDTFACPFPATALGLVGELGTLKVVTDADADEATENPTALTALTVNV